MARTGGSAPRIRGQRDALVCREPTEITPCPVGPAHPHDRGRRIAETDVRRRLALREIAAGGREAAALDDGGAGDRGGDLELGAPVRGIGRCEDEPVSAAPLLVEQDAGGTAEIGDDEIGIAVAVEIARREGAADDGRRKVAALVRG